MSKSLHAALVKIGASRFRPLSLSPLLKGTTHCLTVLTFTVLSPQIFSKHQWMSVGTFFFCMEESNSTPKLHTYSKSDPICNTAPLLPSDIQQQNVMGYWEEGSTSTTIPRTSASQVVGKKKKERERHYFQSSPHTLSASQVVCSWLGTSTAEKPSGVENSTTTLHSCVCRRGSELFQIKLL